MLRKTLVIAAAAVTTWSCAQPVNAQVRLIGMTGNQSQGTWNDIPQESLFEINVTNGSSTFLSSLGFGFDSQSIGYNSEDGMLYRTAGIDTYRCGTVGHYSFNDTQYMEKMVAADLAANTPIDTVAIFNADPLGRPKPAPRPDWVYPQEVRDDVNDPCNEPDVENTNNEYNALRGLAYSAAQDVFFGTDLSDGIFKMTPAGESTYWTASPRDGNFPAKGIAVLKSGNSERLFVSGLEPTADFGEGRTAELLELDPITGAEIRAISLQDWNENQDGSRAGVAGIVAISFHPETGVLYGVGKGLASGASDPDQRELVTIDIDTGILTLLGDVSDPGMGINLASMSFIFPVDSKPPVEGDTDGDGDVDIVDLNNVRNNFGNGGNPILGDTSPFDGNVDIVDLNNVRNNFGAGPGGANAVPEPSTALLALCGLAALGFRFRRK